MNVDEFRSSWTIFAFLVLCQLANKGVIDMASIRKVDHAEIRAILVKHLIAAATRNADLLQEAFTPEAIFVGTDDEENWTIDQYVQLLEGSENGWDMTNCTERFIYEIVPAYGNVAGFFETVVHEEYGPMRASGIVVRNSEGKWQIAHYVLSFSIPNRVVDQSEFTMLMSAQ